MIDWKPYPPSSTHRTRELASPFAAVVEVVAVTVCSPFLRRLFALPSPTNSSTSPCLRRPTLRFSPVVCSPSPQYHMGVVRGVILDDSVLLTEGEGKNRFTLRPGAESLIRTLSLSKTHIGISYEADYPDDKVSVFQRIASLYSIDCFILNDPTSHVMPAWSINTDGSIVYLVSIKKEFLPKLSSYKWLLVVLNDGDESSYYTTDAPRIQNLFEFPLTICQLNKSSMGTNAATVGYLMKPSRMEDFAKRGAFPLCPTQNGLMFVPLTPMLPLSTQLKDVDIVLHKSYR
ncbi:hypothetical protein PIB30_074258 [Stylosanthes scabra]|uniref:Uncharacterized protein n=1 Tax=Stylosanthes scabra TaxID=79078 RepID=A0ABU6SPT6_9FABA|nr:hypothetical protein [Stylosanthes scabra]